MAAKEVDFPNLHGGFWQQTSDPDINYNCVGFAAGRTDVVWWPEDCADPRSEYWPAGVRREETVAAFMDLFRLLGYEPTPDGTLEYGYEKIAIFAKGQVPTHVARQLSNGHWTSKLGVEDDIVHETPESLDGPCYGAVAQFMRRKTATS